MRPFWGGNVPELYSSQLAGKRGAQLLSEGFMFRSSQLHAGKLRSLGGSAVCWPLAHRWMLPWCSCTLLLLARWCGHWAWQTACFLVWANPKGKSGACFLSCCRFMSPVTTACMQSRSKQFFQAASSVMCVLRRALLFCSPVRCMSEVRHLVTIGLGNCLDTLDNWATKFNSSYLTSC